MIPDPLFIFGLLPIDVNLIAKYNNKSKSKIKLFYVSRLLLNMDIDDKEKFDNIHKH